MFVAQYRLASWNEWGNVPRSVFYASDMEYTSVEEAVEDLTSYLHGLDMYIGRVIHDGRSVFETIPSLFYREVSPNAHNIMSDFVEFVNSGGPYDLPEPIVIPVLKF